MRITSSIASSRWSASDRMCVMYTPPYGAIAFDSSISSSVVAKVLGG